MDKLRKNIQIEIDLLKRDITANKIRIGRSAHAGIILDSGTVFEKLSDAEYIRLQKEIDDKEAKISELSKQLEQLSDDK